MARINWGGLLIFLLLAFGLAWAVAIPLWLKDGLSNPLFLPLSLAMMYTPAVAAIVATKVAEPGAKLLEALALRRAKGAVGGIVLYSLFGVFAALFICIGGLAVGQAFGVYRLDLEHFSAFRALLEDKLAAVGKPWPAQMPPLWVLVLAQGVTAVVLSPVNAVAALGEELGWRGYLLPKLMPLGTVPAIIVSGVIWGLWHAPLVLLGYNYQDSPPWLALSCMAGMCVALGAMLAWLRLRTTSIWPCALFHGAINAAAAFYAILGVAGDKIDLTQASLLGWTGWIIPLALAALLFVVMPPKRAVT